MRTTRLVVGAVVLVSGMLVSFSAAAQDNSVQFKLGGYFPTGESDFWAQTEDAFTFDVSDLDDWFWSFSFIHSMNNHVELGANFDLYDAWTVSGYRDYVDNRGFQILHDTRLRSYPISVDLRFVPFGRYAIRGPQGRRVQRPVLYLGGGLGANFWEYEEVGDFINFGDPDLPVFFGRFRDSGVAFQAHGLIGVELPFGRRWSFVGEAKYSWSEATLGAGFPVDFRDVDLGGLSVTAGASLRF
jgi:hypothetical protein